MIDGLFTLPKDILLEPIESLPDTVLTGFEHKSGDFALTRPQSRIHTHIVNDSTAKLLQIFREPVTIADAIITFSRTEHADPAASSTRHSPCFGPSSKQGCSCHPIHISRRQSNS